MARRGPAVETISGPQGTGRSTRLAARLREEAARAPCVIVDPADHWTGSRADLLPGDAVRVRASTFAAGGADLAEVLCVMMHRSPGIVLGVDDAELVPVPPRSWSRIYAAAAATGSLLIVVVPQAVDSIPRSHRPLAEGRVAALAAAMA